MSNPYLRGFEDGRNAAINQIDLRLAEIIKSPSPHLHNSEIIVLEDIRKRIVERAK